MEGQWKHFDLEAHDAAHVDLATKSKKLEVCGICEW